MSQEGGDVEMITKCIKMAFKMSQDSFDPPLLKGQVIMAKRAMPQHALPWHAMPCHAMR